MRYDPKHTLTNAMRRYIVNKSDIEPMFREIQKWKEYNEIIKIKKEKDELQKIISAYMFLNRKGQLVFIK